MMSEREVGGKAKASSPLNNFAKNARTTPMEVDGASGGGEKAKGVAAPAASSSGQARLNGGSAPNTANAPAGSGGKRQRKPKAKPKPGDPGWEAFKRKRNKRRAEQIRLKKKNGRRSPYALYIDAAGVSAEQSKRIPISLTEWKTLLQQALVRMAEDMLDMEKEGVDSPGDKLYLAHQCFVEHRPKGAPKGVPTSTKPDNERFGHGAMFFDTEEAESFAARAFRDTTVVREGKRFEIALDQKEIDRRACYTMVAPKVVWQAVHVYFWRCVRYAYKGLPPGEPEIVKEKATDRSDAYIVLVIRTERIWERCLDGMDERVFKLPFGRFVLRKKSEGIWPKPQVLPTADEAEAEAEVEEEESVPTE